MEDKSSPLRIKCPYSWQRIRGWRLNSGSRRTDDGAQMATHDGLNTRFSFQKRRPTRICMWFFVSTAWLKSNQLKGMRGWIDWDLRSWVPNQIDRREAIESIGVDSSQSLTSPWDVQKVTTRGQLKYHSRLPWRKKEVRPLCFSIAFVRMNEWHFLLRFKPVQYVFDHDSLNDQKNWKRPTNWVALKNYEVRHSRHNHEAKDDLQKQSQIPK